VKDAEEEALGTRRIPSLSMRSKMLILTVPFVVCTVLLSSAAAPFLLSCLGGKENQSEKQFYLGYALNSIRILRYECVVSTGQNARLPQTAQSVPDSCTVSLRVQKGEEGAYAIRRNSTNRILGGPNATIVMDAKGNLDAVVAETMHVLQITRTINMTIDGSGYFLELPPLPGRVISLGSNWTGTFRYNLSIRHKTPHQEGVSISIGQGTIECEVIGRENIETPAGNFSAVRLRSSATVTGVSYAIMDNGSRRIIEGPAHVKDERTYLVDTDTGIVVFATITRSGVGESTAKPLTTIMSLVDIKRE